MNIKYLPAQQKDCSQIADWINDIGHGHIEYLFDGLVASRTALQQLTKVLQEDEYYSYKNVDFALDGKRVVGLVFSYTADANALTPEMQSYFSKDRIEWMRYFSDNQVKNSWYINTLGVAKEYRRHGIATKLLNCASQRALKNGIQRLSLHVYENNVTAINLYESCGFIKEKRMDLAGHPFFTTRNLCANFLMKCNL